MHGLRTDLLLEQTKSIGIKTTIIELPKQPSMDVYEKTMLKTTDILTANGFTHSAFGDIFLEDLRNYRDKQLSI